MFPIWKNLPIELYYRITDYLNPALRRDLGLKPKKITNLPYLDIPTKSYKNIYDQSVKRLLSIEIDSHRVFSYTVYAGYNNFIHLSGNKYIFTNTSSDSIYFYIMIKDINNSSICMALYHELYNEQLVLDNVKIIPFLIEN